VEFSAATGRLPRLSVGRAVVDETPARGVVR
jgi:hypothetical protein